MRLFQKKTIGLIFLIICGGIVLFLPTAIKAQGPSTPPTCSNPVETEFGPVCNVTSYINGILDWLIPVLGGVSLLIFIAAGYLYMTSQGNQTQIDTAKTLIIGTITGILLLFLAGLLLREIGVL